MSGYFYNIFSDTFRAGWGWEPNLTHTCYVCNQYLYIITGLSRMTQKNKSMFIGYKLEVLQFTRLSELGI